MDPNFYVCSDSRATDFVVAERAFAGTHPAEEPIPDSITATSY